MMSKVLALLWIFIAGIDLPPADVEIPDSVAQGEWWSEADHRARYHHLTQGTRIMPYAWFINLRQPRAFGGRLADPAYLSRFGFIPDATHPVYNEAGLPIGFAVDEEFRDPVTGEDESVVGFTCAACHTGELRHQGERLLIEGGAAMIDLEKFRTALGASVQLTIKLPWRFDEFADAVLEEDDDKIRRSDLKRRLERFANERKRQLFAQRERFEPGCCGNVELGPPDACGRPTWRGPTHNAKEGFGRLDALTRIGNTVYGEQAGPGDRGWENFRAVDAPVAYPHIWGTYWFDWVQYNSSIRQPLARNVGEALGVNAPIQLRGDEDRRLGNTVKIGNLYELESSLAGPHPHQGLLAPEWPSAWNSDDGVRARAIEGAKHYARYCRDCHLDPSDVRDLESAVWLPNEDYPSHRLLKLVTKPVDFLCTDPQQAVSFDQRWIYTGAEEKPTQKIASALQEAMTLVPDRWFELEGTNPDDREKMRGHRPNQVRSRVNGKVSYRARPLDGVWATPPFLHNGSVPSLFELLSPLEERSVTFCLGSKEFDPVGVGYDTDCSDGTFLLDTRERGNWNGGHEFTDVERPGRIGPELSRMQRYELIEYLKTIRFDAVGERQ